MISGYHEPDVRLDSLVARDYDDEGDALAAIVEATAIINREIEMDYARARESGVEGFAAGDIGDRLRKWIKKLVEFVKSVARRFSALSYSISVSAPFGVSATVSWSSS